MRCGSDGQVSGDNTDLGDPARSGPQAAAIASSRMVAAPLELPVQNFFFAATNA